MPELPTTFGKYYLTEKLATGGMAEIYLAKIVGPGGFEKQLVIKQIHPKLTGQRHFVDLFVAEAKTLVTLAHGNIVPVYELGVVEDTYFIAMDYIDGPTLYRLTEMLARRDEMMEPALAAWITARILEGLDYAHRKGEGVIHRDLSPRNVMLSRDGEVKLVDFGIAVTLGAAGEGEDVQAVPTGSFPYMSPEQVRREPLTGQTDLFSAGVLMWEMLVGHRLFARADPESTLAAVVSGDIPRPSSERPEVPARLDEVVMRALERDRGARWTDAGEMLGALQRYLYSLDETPGPRDIAALVARYCPPETRRMPTHSEALGEPEAGSDGDPAIGTTEATPPPAPAGPRTAVIPRDGAKPAGKARPPRHQSFATHVELEGMLERATPMFGVEALEGPTTTVVAPRAAPAPAPATAPTEAPPDSTLRMRTERGLPGSTPPSRGLLVAAGLGATILAIAAVVVFLRGREAVLAEEAGVRDAAPAAVVDAAIAPAVDAGVAPDLPDASIAHTVDAGLARVDARTPPVDAAERPRPRDGGSEPVRVDVRPQGTATLKVGADPWGEIVIDGVRRGRTPATLEVTAGKHVIEVIFAGEDPPRKKSFPVELAPGATHDIVADFTDR